MEVVTGRKTSVSKERIVPRPHLLPFLSFFSIPFFYSTPSPARLRFLVCPSASAFFVSSLSPSGVIIRYSPRVPRGPLMEFACKSETGSREGDRAVSNAQRIRGEGKREGERGETRRRPTPFCLRHPCRRSVGCIKCYER